MACLRTPPNLPVPRRWIPLVFFTIFATILWIYSPVRKSPWSWPSDPSHTWRHSSSTSDRQFLHKPSEDDLSANIPITKVDFQPGVVKATGKPYTRTLIVPRTASEDTGWIQELVNKDKYFDYKVYVVDAKDAPLSPPKNKGHEVMVYLTYIIDHYHNLSDVNIFMHSHRHAWHSNELLDGDAVQIVSRLSSDRVQRDGYINLRCHWDPGYPSWINLGNVEEDVGKQEQTIYAGKVLVGAVSHGSDSKQAGTALLCTVRSVSGQDQKLASVEIRILQRLVARDEHVRLFQWEGF